MYFSTHFFSTQVLNTFRGISATGHTQLWVGLFISDPTATGAAGVEIAYPGYQRQEMAFTPPAMHDNHLAIHNTQEITWPISDQTLPAITHIGIFNSPVAGNMLLRGELTVPLTINPNQQPSIMAGDIMYWGRGNFSEAFRGAYLNILRGITLPGLEPHMALFDGNPEAGGFELSGAGYARALMSFAAPILGNNGVMSVRNENIITFPRALGTWGQWTHDAITHGGTSEIIGVLPNDPIETIHRNYNPRIAQGEYEIWHS